MPSEIEPKTIQENRAVIMGVEFNLDDRKWDWVEKDVSDYTPDDILNANMFQSAVSGFGGSASSQLCPTTHTCVPVEGANGMFVRSLQNGRLYFSERGYQRYVNGANIDWAGVARDLGLILAGTIGGVGEVLAAIGLMTGTAAWGIGFWSSGGTNQ